MTHSQQPSIDILKKRASKYSGVEGVKIKSILLNIASDVSRLPQEQTTNYMNILRLNYLNSEKEERMSFHKLDDLNDCELFGMDIRDLLAQGATNIHIS